MRYGENKWPDIPDQADKVVVLPLGSMEQHGRHLPLLTDTIICQEIVGRAEAALGDEALFLPAVWVGVSEHHRGFPGTVSVQQRTYVRLLSDMMESLIGGGFRRIVLLNAHGGNDLPGRTAVYETQMRHGERRDLWLVFATWYTLAAPQIAALSALQQKWVTHSCELETSAILRLRPELVDMEAARGAAIEFESAFYRPDSGRASRVSIVRPFEHVSKTGAYGHPELATSEKGEAILAAAVGELVAFLREVATWPSLEPT
jgi:creatinine amidohydrolase